MGTGFFKSSAKPMQASGMNMEARAIGANNYAGRQAGSGAAKDIGAAMAINKSGKPLQKSQRSAAYAPGPKKL